MPQVNISINDMDHTDTARTALGNNEIAVGQ